MRLLLLSLLALLMVGCATTHTSPRVMSELAQGKRYFEDGYYKKSMQQLLPLACDGNSEAQYAIGYMYYYGYGVAQDTFVGSFWIKRAAEQHYTPANEALITIAKDRDEDFHVRDRLKS